MKAPHLPVAAALLSAILLGLGGQQTDRAFSPARARAQTQVSYDFAADVSSSTRALVQDTVGSALRFFAETFQYALSDSFTVHVYSKRDERNEAFLRIEGWPREQGLRIIGPRGWFAHPASASRTGRGSVWILLEGCRTHPVSPDNLDCSFKKSLYHEMFHLWQHRFESGVLDGPHYGWLVEGTADFAAYLGIQQLGLASAQEIMLFLRRQAMRYGTVGRLSELDLRRVGYYIPTLAIFRLAGDEPARITAFFRHPSFRQDWQRAFESVFGRTVQAFEQEFQTYLQETMR